MVADINPAGGSIPGNMADINGTLFFRASDGVTGEEFWKSNGGTLASGGTARVADIYPGAGDSAPDDFTSVGGTVFFTATDGIHGVEPWKSNGAGVAMVKDINAAGDSYPSDLAALGGALFFSATDTGADTELWRAAAEPFPAGGGSSATGTTGQRAKALKKCKKRFKRNHDRKKLKKCKKKAKLLPVSNHLQRGRLSGQRAC